MDKHRYAQHRKEFIHYGKVRFDPDIQSIIFQVTEQYQYELPLDRVKNRAEFNGWVVHLTPKRWFAEMETDFLRVCYEVLPPSITGLYDELVNL